MQWYTRENAKTDKVASAWLIARRIDPEAAFVFLPEGEVNETARREGGRSFDMDGGDHPHRDGGCAFETLMTDHGLWGADPALDEMALIVHTADVGTRGDDERFRIEGLGLPALGKGFAETTPDDHEKLRLQFPLYDALYAFCRLRLEGRDRVRK